MSYHTERIKAFGTEVEYGVAFDNDDDKVSFQEYITKFIDRFDETFSRFRGDSELSYINTSAGGLPVGVSPEMTEMLLLAKRAYNSTGGRFDPTILPRLEQLGYDRDFGSIVNTHDGSKLEVPLMHVRTFSSVRVSAADNTVSLPEDTKIDLGGIAKGYAADQLAKYLRKFSSNFWISVGGDMVVFGPGESGKGWEVGLQNPLSIDQDITKLHFSKDRLMGVATSGITKRHGIKDGQPWHHLIDPKTYSPASNDLLTATVVAPEAWWADVLAKTVMIEGEEGGLALLDDFPETAGLAINNKLELLTSPAMDRYLYAE